MIVEVIWSLVTLAGLARSVWILGEALEDRKSLGTDTNGRRLVANWQVEHSALGSLIYTLLLSPGVMALAYELGMTSLKERLFIVPFFVVAAVVVLVIRQERDARYRRRQLARRSEVDQLQRTADHAIGIAADTNRKVTDLHELQADEQLDREEGREHRGVGDDH